ncbi:AEC family transporter [Azospirillum halopraeferens]|uniref:AEC family transporter n=1 Tax=Azospirillum halopraeferens TaxID=34010 RepID=UPI0004054621|nr:AEC family transporter [Azospirillum halopraeferens]
MNALAPLAGVAAVVAPVFVAAAVGYVWLRRRLPFDSAFVTAFVVNVATPCLVFSTLTRVRFAGEDLMQVALAAVAILVLTAVVGAVVLRAFRLELRPYLPGLMFPNGGNMGLPVCLFAFGEAGLAYGIVYFTVLSVTQFVLGPAIAAGRSDPGQVLRIPLLYVVAAALAVRGLDVAVPVWIVNATTMLGNAAVPLMLVSLGVALARLQGGGTGRALALSALRLGLGAAAGFAVATAMGLEGAMFGVVVLESAMPVAVFNYLWAQKYGNAPEEVAGMVLGSTALSFVALPVLLLLVM